jgi:hypothetical protein
MIDTVLTGERVLLIQALQEAVREDAARFARSSRRLWSSACH